MNIEQQKFLAEQKADLDWHKVGSNENPYSKEYQTKSFAAYNDRFQLVSDEWAKFTGSAV